MKRLFAFALICAAACCLHAQVVDTTVCDVLKNPQTFNGKTVRIKGTVSAGFDQFVVKGPGCGQYVNAIWLAYPEGTKAKSGPAAVLQLQAAKNFASTAAEVQRTPVVLEKSKDFKQFDSLLSAPNKGAGLCLGCTRYEVNATLVGRLDGVESAVISRDAAGKVVSLGGFGNMNAYKARLVLQSVSDVSPQELDFSKVNAITKAEAAAPGAPQGNGAPLDAVRKMGAAYPEGNPSRDLMQRAAGAYGKPNEQNGVVISFAGANEATAKLETKGTVDSPDGVLFNCIFSKSRLPDEGLSVALASLGSLVIDFRTPPRDFENPSLYDYEYRAAVSSAVAAMTTGRKSLTLPGGYMIWSSTWPPADFANLLNTTILDFLGKQELLSR